MMKTAILASLIAAATAFAPAAQHSSRPSVQLQAAAELENMIGSDVENPGGPMRMDPVGLSDWIPADYLRRAELSNGRSAMLAIVGWYWPALVGTFASDDVTTVDPIKAFLEADPQWWAQFIVLCGTVEAIKYRGEMEGKSFTGDGPAVIDWSKTWDKLDADQKASMRLKELKNGRLAMMAFAAVISDYFIPGSVPGLPHIF